MKHSQEQGRKWIQKKAPPQVGDLLRVFSENKANFGRISVRGVNTCVGSSRQYAWYHLYSPVVADWVEWRKWFDIHLILLCSSSLESSLTSRHQRQRGHYNHVSDSGYFCWFDPTILSVLSCKILGKGWWNWHRTRFRSCSLPVSRNTRHWLAWLRVRPPWRHPDSVRPCGDVGPDPGRSWEAGGVRRNDRHLAAAPCGTSGPDSASYAA